MFQTGLQKSYSDKLDEQNWKKLFDRFCCLNLKRHTLFQQKRQMLMSAEFNFNKLWCVRKAVVKT